MARKKWIDRKNATTFALVHRAQNDPRIHDSEASDMVFAEISGPADHKTGKDRGALEDELDLDPDSIRANEGEAANYGVYYDDSNYDYMQHLRDLGSSSDAHFVEAPKPASKQKNKMKLEDMLRETSLDNDAPQKDSAGKSVLPEDLMPSKNMRHTTYQDQQDIPDALAGFQPDMDPRLREVLEALEDDAYIDEGEDKDIFGELAKGGEELSTDEFEDLGWGHGDEDYDDEGPYEEDEGWETDETAKPDKEYKTAKPSQPLQDGDNDAEEGDDDWLNEFREFKKDQKANKTAAPKPKPAASIPDGLSSIVTGSSALTNGRHKKRKGAMTSTSAYSMTSSTLFRTEGQTLLDDRFDKIEEEYNEDGDFDDFPDDDTASVVTGMTGMTGQSGASTSTQAGPMRSDFDSIMDDFLGGYSMAGKRRVKKGGYQTGMEQLDELRRGLGPARFSSKSKQRA